MAEALCGVEKKVNHTKAREAFSKSASRVFVCVAIYWWIRISIQKEICQFNNFNVTFGHWMVATTRRDDFFVVVPNHLQ